MGANLKHPTEQEEAGGGKMNSVLLRRGAGPVGKRILLQGRLRAPAISSKPAGRFKQKQEGGGTANNWQARRLYLLAECTRLSSSCKVRGASVSIEIERL